MLRLCIGGFAMLALGALTAASADPSQDNYEKMSPGETLVLPADVGTTKAILGKGFSDAGADIDAAGKQHRLFPPKGTESEEDRYDTHLEVIDNRLELGANARLLFARAGVKASSTKRYAVLRVSHIDKVVTLDADGSPQDTAPLMAFRVYYGWALYYVLEGDAEMFTADLATSLGKAGPQIDVLVQRFHLQKYLRTIGVSAKTPGEVVIATSPEEITEKFEVAKTSYPIFVEYRVMKDVFAEKIEWKKAQLQPGAYRLEAVRVEVMSTKADGRPWDALNDPPDPLIQISLDGTTVGSCLVRNQFKADCALHKVVILRKDSVLEMIVLDKDLVDNDDVGTARAEGFVDSGSPYRAIDLQTDGQLARAQVVFVPMSN